MWNNNVLEWVSKAVNTKHVNNVLHSDFSNLMGTLTVRLIYLHLQSVYICDQIQNSIKTWVTLPAVEQLYAHRPSQGLAYLFNWVVKREV